MDTKRWRKDFANAFCTTLSYIAMKKFSWNSTSGFCFKENCINTNIFASTLVLENNISKPFDQMIRKN